MAYTRRNQKFMENHRTEGSVTTQDSNGNSGYGKVDAYETLKIIDKYASVAQRQAFEKGWIHWIDNNEQLAVYNYQQIDQAADVFLYNSLGQLLATGKTGQGHAIPLNSLSSGVYHCRIMSANRILASFSLVK